MSKREAAQVLKTMDDLGLALADKGHTWTAKERADYEKAVRILQPMACG